MPNQFDSFGRRMVLYNAPEQEAIFGRLGPTAEEYEQLQERCVSLEEKNRQLEAGSGLCSVCQHGRGIDTIAVQLLAGECMAVTYPSGMPLRVQHEDLPDVISLLKELVQLRRMGR